MQGLASFFVFFIFLVALLHNSQAVDNKNEFLRRFYNNFRLSQGQLKTYATTPQCNAIIRNY